MLLVNKDSNIILNKNQLTEIFFSGCKTDENIGVESEKLLVYKDNYKAVKYEDVIKILCSFDENKWQKIYDLDNLVGLKSNIGTITLEPGSQIELSLKPYATLREITEKLSDFYSKLSIYADRINVKVLDVGIQPVSTFENIEVIPKKRYEFMTKYLPLKQLTPFVMMRETAGIQANFDYKSEEDAVKKLSIALKMSPIISAVYSNSSVRNSKKTEFKSYRANSWLNVDEQRCGLVSEKLFAKNLNFTFMDYVEILLDIPVIFIQRGNKYYGCTKTFREFMLNGHEGIYADLSDWENHISLYFPDVRLKSYVEIRNHDAQNSSMTYSVPAFWKGIIYNSDAIAEVSNILVDFSYEDFMKLRKETPVNGINSKLGKYVISDLVKEFFNISYSSLKENKNNDEKYLEPVFEYITLNQVPSDNQNV